MSGTESSGWWQDAGGNWYQSATPPGPGWWLAPDGRWYPPTAAQPPQGMSPYPLDPRQQVYYDANPYAQGAPYMQPGEANTLAKTGGTLGIVGAALSLIPLFGIFIGIIMGVLAIIFSGIGLSRSSRMPDSKGLAVAGLVLGILTVIFKLIPGINLL